MNLADEMNLHVGSFLRHRQGSMGSLFCQSDVLWTVPDVRLYPPAEGKGVTVRVVGPGSIKLNRLSGFDSQWERRQAAITVTLSLVSHDNDRIGVSPPLFCPLHAGRKIVEDVRIEPLFILP